MTHPTRPRIVKFTPEFDAKISELFPSEASGDNPIPSQHQFVTEAMPLIKAVFETHFDELTTVDGRNPDYRFTEFQRLLIDLIRVYGYRVHNFAPGQPDTAYLYDLRITPKLEIYQGDEQQL